MHFRDQLSKPLTVVTVRGKLAVRAHLFSVIEPSDVLSAWIPIAFYYRYFSVIKSRGISR